MLMMKVSQMIIIILPKMFGILSISDQIVKTVNVVTRIFGRLVGL